MNNQVKKSLQSAIQQFGRVKNVDAASFSESLQKVFDSDAVYLDKVALLDKAFDDYPAFESLREVFFDLLLINFFTEDVQKLEEDYLESKEWEEIEEETLDRGTELLNVLLYIKECEDEDIDPDLDDFLKEFLLVEEDEFQDEHRIYEEVIANQVLVESSPDEIARVAKSLPEFSELKELFYPMINFFRDQDPDKEEFDTFISNSLQPEFDAAVYQLLITYNKPN
ncbi:MAG: hypothetical protein JWN56_894 [Sphingobacteriales bacterium]|nr:hypothetical protein [Sphingobacteriales bacterium]